MSVFYFFLVLFLVTLALLFYAFDVDDD